MCGQNLGLLREVLLVFLRTQNESDCALHSVRPRVGTTIWALVYAILPGGVDSSYWILFSLTTAVYIMMYILMYAAAIRLRYTHPNVKRPFTIPGGKVGIWVVGRWGIVAMAILLMLTLIPPSQISFIGRSPVFYLELIAAGALVVLAIPLVICTLKKPGWNLAGETEASR